MPSTLPPVPHRAPVLGLDGFLTPVWSEWLQKVFLRIGGNTAYTNDELGDVSTDMIQDAAITSAKLAAAVAGDGLAGGAGTALSVNTDGSTLEISSDILRVKDLGISTAKLAASAVSFAKLLSTDWSSSIGTSGYQKLPSGLYIQWGVTSSVASGGNTSPTFPVAFPTACLQVVASIRDNSAALNTTTGQAGTGGYSTTSFSIYNRTSIAQTFNWIAIGN